MNEDIVIGKDVVMSHDEFVKELLSDPKVLEEYVKLELPFNLYSELVKARNSAGLTQEEVAIKMGTKQSGICRLENNLLRGIMPSLTTLRKYAEAVNRKIQIRLVEDSDSD